MTDNTGLTGGYDLEIKPKKGTPEAFFKAAGKQLGLKLTAGKGDVEMVVVESVKK